MMLQKMNKGDTDNVYILRNKEPYWN